jgi:hypothetical protein
MSFSIKRYLYGLSIRKHLFALVFVPPFAYFLLAAVSTDKYTIRQVISVTEETPIAVSSSPVEFEFLEDTLSRPSQFFKDPFAVRELDNLLDIGITDPRQRAQAIQSRVGSAMMLTLDDSGRAVISYSGGEQSLGEILVEYYSSRLIRKAVEGRTRLERSSESRDREGVEQVQEVGGQQLFSERSLWRNERVVPIGIWALLSFLAVLVLIGILEWLDPSFKSERQVARYLGVPVLGAVPDLNELFDNFNSSKLNR